MNGLKLAREILLGKDASLVVVKDGFVAYIGYGHGLRELMNLALEGGEILENAAVADRVVGGAAATIMIKHGVNAVYGHLISRQALSLLKEIEVEYGEIIDFVRGRDGGVCPFEKIVLDSGDIDTAYKRLMNKLYGSDGYGQS